MSWILAGGVEFITLVAILIAYGHRLALIAVGHCWLACIIMVLANDWSCLIFASATPFM